MAKFLDDTGLSRLWDKIKSKFYTKTETDTLLGNKLNKFCYPAGSSFNLTFNCLGGLVTSAGTDIYVFIPMIFCEKIPDKTKLRIRLVLRHVEGGYVYYRIGTTTYSYRPIGSDYELMWRNGATAITGGVKDVYLTNLSDSGFTLRLNFYGALAKDANGTALKNNTPLAVMVVLDGNIAS